MNDRPSNKQLLVGFLLTLAAVAVVIAMFESNVPWLMALAEKIVSVFSIGTIFGLFAWLVWGLFIRRKDHDKDQ